MQCFSWFKQASAFQNVIIDGPTTLQQAEKYANFLGYQEFKGSSRWLDGFKKRNNIKFKSTVGEAGLVDTGVVDNWLKNVLPHFLKGYYPDDIYKTIQFFKH